MVPRGLTFGGQKGKLGVLEEETRKRNTQPQEHVVNALTDSVFVWKPRVDAQYWTHVALKAENV